MSFRAVKGHGGPPRHLGVTRFGDAASGKRITMTTRLLLASNSTNHGEGYLDHCMGEMLDILGGRRRLAFVPFALLDRDRYAAKASERFGQEGLQVRAVAAGGDGEATLEWAEAVFVGGGNTFRLLKTLRDNDLLSAMRRRVREGMIYMGASAGSNVAGPTIRTTNDMPIVQPDSFESLGLVPFQINPHYIDPPAASVHMGETREQRLVEYLEENDIPVVGVREGAWIRVEDGRARLGGARPARVFQVNATPEERPPGADLSDLRGRRDGGEGL
jgi:dipeptidase E